MPKNNNHIVRIDPGLLIFNFQGELQPGWEEEVLFCRLCEELTAQWVRRAGGDHGVESKPCAVCQICNADHLLLFP